MSLIHPALGDAFLRSFSLTMRLHALEHPPSISELTNGRARLQLQQFASGGTSGLAQKLGLTDATLNEPKIHARSA